MSPVTEKERRLHNHAKHFAKRLAYMSADDVSGRHEAAMAAFDQEWLQLLQAHNAVLAHKFDDGLLAYEFFLLGTELRRRRRPANEQDHGAGAALQYAKRQGVIPHTRSPDPRGHRSEQRTAFKSGGTHSSGGTAPSTLP